jgi:hypothetical protein
MASDSWNSHDAIFAPDLIVDLIADVARAPGGLIEA